MAELRVGERLLHRLQNGLTGEVERNNAGEYEFLEVLVLLCVRLGTSGDELLQELLQQFLRRELNLFGHLYAVTKSEESSTHPK